jgi:hypothetical protein
MYDEQYKSNSGTLLAATFSFLIIIIGVCLKLFVANENTSSIGSVMIGFGIGFLATIIYKLVKN